MRNIFGDIPVNEIATTMIAEVLNSLIKANKFGTLRKLRILIGQAIHYAIATGKAVNNPTPVLKND